MPSRLRPFPTRLLTGASPLWWLPGTEYLVAADFFDIPSVTYTYIGDASARAEFHGSAVTSRSSLLLRSYTGSGSIVAGGYSERVRFSPTIKVYNGVMSSYMKLEQVSGVHAHCRTKAAASAGALATAGTAPHSRIKVVAGTGVLASAGSGSQSRCRAYVGSGAIASAGSSVRSRVICRGTAVAIASSGSSVRARQIVRGGTAALSFAAYSALLKVLVRAATASLSLSGTVGVCRARAASGSAASSVLGSSAVSRTRSPSSAASCVIAGSATYEFTVHDDTVYTQWMSYDSDHEWVSLPLDPQWSDVLDSEHATYGVLSVASLTFAVSAEHSRTRSKASAVSASFYSSVAPHSRTRAKDSVLAMSIAGGAAYGQSHLRAYVGLGALSAAGSSVCIGPHQLFVHASTIWMSVSGATQFARTRARLSSGAMSTAASAGYNYKLTVREYSGVSSIVAGGSASVARSRIRYYYSSAPVVSGGSSVVARSRVYIAKIATAITGGAAISIKLDGHYYGSIGYLNTSGSSQRSKTLVRAGSGALAIAGSASTTARPVSVKAYAGVAHLATGGTYSRLRTIARVGTLGLALTCHSAVSFSRVHQGAASALLGGSGLSCRAHGWTGAAALLADGASTVCRAHGVDGRASLAVSGVARVGLGIGVHALKAVATLHGVHVAFGEVLETVVLDSPISDQFLVSSCCAFGISTTSHIAAREVLIDSGVHLVEEIGSGTSMSCVLASPVCRSITFDSLTIK